MFFLSFGVMMISGFQSYSHAGALSPFSGSWRGSGSLVLDTGKKELVRCRLNVKVTVGGTKATQSIRCASTGRDVIISSNLSAKATKVGGSWTETTIGSSGGLSGRIKGKNISLRMTGPDVAASLSVTASGSSQRLSVSGKLGPIRKMFVKLRRRGK